MDKVVQIRKEIIETLKAFGYEDASFVEKENTYEISFHVNNGSETFLQRHKDAISMLAKGFLCMFYYTNNRQQVIIYKKCRGLDPDDERYSCLLHEMCLVGDNKTKKEDVCGKEIFINMYDRFERVILEEPITKHIKKLLEDETIMDNQVIPNEPIQVDRFRGITNEMAELHARKNADYGDSFGQTYRELGIISAVTRMSDKMNRLKRLVAHKDAQQVKDESIDDTLIDLACYAVMTLMERRREHE